MSDNTDNANATENQVEESSITMLDVLEQEKELEDEYAAVLGASDEKCCTYEQGAVKRQALYSCLTCCPDATKNLGSCAGICLACSYRCHENHELVELYTKRNFRCDCPTQRFSSNRCLLNTSLKLPQPLNTENQYNQNFQGLYCTCKRPYPDPERTTEEVMLQCTVCEDWFHLHHMNVKPGAAKLIDVCSEIVCDACMEQHTFLQDYAGLALKVLDNLDESEITGDVSVCEDNDNKLHSDLDKSISEILNIGEDEQKVKQQQKQRNDSVKNSEDGEPETKKQKLNETEIPIEKREDKTIPTGSCRRQALSKANYVKGATFWGNNWRAALCRCKNCILLYKTEKVEFLLDEDDSAKSYEERGMKRAANETSTYEQGILALASIDRVQQIDAITEYNRMKDKLKDYLQTFAVNKKVVTEDDIKRFFEEMRNEKNANVGQPYFCR